MEEQSASLDQFWSLPAEKVFELVGGTAEGLDAAAAAARLKQFGPNTFKPNSKVSAVRLFLSQFKSPVTLLLIAAAILSAGLNDRTDTLIILLIVLISGLLGFWQEHGAANAVAELMKLVQVHCEVLRSGKLQQIQAEEIVPGDILTLSAGDLIPGDSLLLEASDLFVDEAAFTGETYPVEKTAGLVPANTPLPKRSNVLLMGSHVISGKAKILVVKTAKETEFGKISSDLQLRAPETDFERGIRKFGYLLMEITLLLVLVIFAVNVLLHKPALDSFLFSLALAVGLTPQLLPAIISVNLAIGARRMARQQVIVKRLSAIENFGSMTMLCSDKTGTITEGKVHLKDTLDMEGNHSDKVLKYAWLNASLQQGFHNPIDEAICGSYKTAQHNYRLQAEIPYDFIRKRLTVQVADATTNVAITKGALSVILAICDRAETPAGDIIKISDCHSAVTKEYEELSNAGLRTLGVAYKPTKNNAGFTINDEKDMIFLGFIAFFDPPKPAISTTISQMNKLGVKLKIITGDNALVAKSLALQIGLHSPKILTGADLLKMSSAALLHQAPLTDIFAEVAPNQKERIIIMLKKAGHVVGFMGDGINDAPALHAADVGISVNSAVDVAKEAADLVLLSQDLNVLNKGIVEGRKTFTNTMKYIFMATSANFGNMFSMAGASLFLPYLPLLPKQILLTNLLTDLPEMAISTDRVDTLNTQLPQHWDMGFIRRFMLLFGLLSSVFDYLTFAALLYLFHSGEKTFQTGWFMESVLSATLIVLVVRTRKPFFKSLPGKYLSAATILVLLFAIILPFTPVSLWFGFVQLNWPYYLFMLPVIAGYVLSAELTKRWFYKHFHRSGRVARLK